MLSSNTREILRLLCEELDAQDALTDACIACDALSRFYDGDDITTAFNISCEFLNAQQDALH